MKKNEDFNGILYNELHQEDGSDTFGLKYEDIEKLVYIVKRDKVEVELTITPDNQTVVVRPWKPFTYACPYGRAE